MLAALIQFGILFLLGWFFFTTKIGMSIFVLGMWLFVPIIVIVALMCLTDEVESRKHD